MSWSPGFSGAAGDDFDLHDHLKAATAARRIPIQLVREDRALAYPCRASVMWRVGLALYAKAGGVPWKLAEADPETAYIGISYAVRPVESERPRFVTCCSQVFDADGAGLEFVAYDAHEVEVQRDNPFLSRTEMFRVMTRSLDLYRRERWALVEPPAAVSGEAVVSAAPVSARILSAGTRLFAAASEDLAASDFGQQRWKVRTTVAEFDRSYAAERSPQDSTYRSGAPTILQRYPGYAEHLDRLARFRLEVFLALVPGGETPAACRERDARIADVARRYGIVPTGIHGQ